MGVSKKISGVSVSSEISRTERMSRRHSASRASKYSSVGIQTDGATICSTPIIAKYKKDEFSSLEVSICNKVKSIRSKRHKVENVRSKQIMIGLAIAVLISSAAACYMYGNIRIADSYQINFANNELQRMRPSKIRHSDVLKSYLKVLHDIQENSKRLALEVEVCHQNYIGVNKELRALKVNNAYMEKSLIILGKKAVTYASVVKQQIEEEIIIYDADKVGLTDYALESLGGRIISIYDTETLDRKAWFTFWDVPLLPVIIHQPNNIIQASMQPGNCWCFKGSSGKVRISLYKSIYITAVTLEHISPLISPGRQISSAPKSFAVIGIVPQSKTAVNEETQIPLGNFVYSASGRPWQTYKVYYPSEEQYRGPFELMELWIMTNHGNDKYTCVYRIRVHGVPDENFQDDLLVKNFQNEISTENFQDEVH